MEVKSGKEVAPDAPEEPVVPKKPDVTDPGKVAKVKAREKEESAAKASQTDEDEDEEQETNFFEFILKDEDGEVIADEPYEATLGDGKVVKGRTDENGKVRIENIADPSDVQLKLPRYENENWS